MLTSLLADLPRPVGRIVHLGAGVGGELAAYLETEAAAILLVEAAPDSAAELAAQAAKQPRVEVLQAAISADPRPRPFHVTNFPDLNSLRAPTAELRELFPGLRGLSSDTVQPADLINLLQDRPAPAGSQLLVLETPGEALGILEALNKAGLLQGLDALCLRELRQPLHDGAPPLDRIREFLDAAGFITEMEANPEDPGMPWLTARINRAALKWQAEAEAFQTRIATLTDERDIARKQAADRGTELETAKAQIAALTTERNTARKQAVDRGTELETAKAQIAALTTERNTARKQAADRGAELEATKAQMATLATEHDTAQKQATDRGTELDKARAQIATLTTERDAARKQAAELETAGGTAEHRIRQSRDELLKAEGQIRLLRDLLLTESGL